MNTNVDKYSNLRERLNAFEKEKTEAEKIEEDAFILMANYLSEIEKFQQIKNLKKKDLAKQIGTSASYLTQVFRGDKPLNFITIAKMRKALGIIFVVKAYPKDSYKAMTTYSQYTSTPFQCGGFDLSYSAMLPASKSEITKVEVYPFQCLNAS